MSFNHVFQFSADFFKCHSFHKNTNERSGLLFFCRETQGDLWCAGNPRAVGSWPGWPAGVTAVVELASREFTCRSRLWESGYLYTSLFNMIQKCPPPSVSQVMCRYVSQLKMHETQMDDFTNMFTLYCQNIYLWYLLTLHSGVRCTSPWNAFCRLGKKQHISMKQIFMQFCPDFKGKMLQFSRLQILCGPKHN